MFAIFALLLIDAVVFRATGAYLLANIGIA